MRLIDADALKVHLSNRYMDEIFPDWWELPIAIREKIGLLGSTFKQAILNSPTIEAEPVRHGKWVDGRPYTGSRWKVCSECHKSADHPAGGHEYCGHCGAKMDGGAAK